MSESVKPVWWDVTPDQVGCKSGAITPDCLRAGGWDFLGRDEEVLEEERARVDLWKLSGANKWFLVLRKGRGRGGKIVSTALCFGSEQVSVVIEKFRVIAEVL